MRKIIIGLVCFSFLILLSSCVTPLTMDKIQKVKKEMTHDEFRSQITISPKQAFSLVYSGVNYNIEIYQMQTGTQLQESSVRGGAWGEKTGAREVPVYDDYVFIFNEKGLMYWGFMDELQKAKDELIRQLAPLITDDSKR